MSEKPTSRSGSAASLWWGVDELPRRPGPVHITDAPTNEQFSGTASIFISSPIWDSGTFYLRPGTSTVVFSFEAQDDGTADEWYGACHEFYYIVSGQFTIAVDTDAERIRRGEAECHVVRAGDFFRYMPGWKYRVTCTSPQPGQFLWTKQRAPEGLQERLIPPRTEA